VRANTIERPAGVIPSAGRSRAVIAAVLAAVIFAGGALAFAATNRRHERVSTATPRSSAGSRTAQGIASLQARLKQVPRDARAWAALGFAYVQQARISGDPSYYPKAERALRRSLALDAARNADAMIGMGALAAARHDFAAALRCGERARAINPYSATALGVIGDALVELGRYPEAFAALQKMSDLRPDLASYTRASYAWELRGEAGNAKRALDFANEAAATPNDAAYVAYYQGELLWNAGRVTEAFLLYRQSIAHDPDFVPAYEGIAKAYAAQGNVARAIEQYQTVVTRLPLPQYVIELADLYALAGDPARASEQVALLHAQERLFRANGVNVDVETALFDADHGNDVAGGLAAAEREWGRRRSVFVADALAWSLYANGRYPEALALSEQSLRLGTRNALFLFHKGMIERALGFRAAARHDLRAALAVNPNFSFLWAPRLPAILKGLR
jgi:tetratricopeptide (TPR) repeat protein